MKHYLVFVSLLLLATTLTCMGQEKLGEEGEIPSEQSANIAGENYYVVGAVLKPGVYEIPSEKTILVSQAIAKAGGPLRTAKISKGILVRQQDGKRIEKRVDYEAILRGEREDLEVIPDDVIFIPSSRAKDLPRLLLPDWYDLPPTPSLR